MYVCMCVYIYIYIHTYICFSSESLTKEADRGSPLLAAASGGGLSKRGGRGRKSEGAKERASEQTVHRQTD